MLLILTTFLACRLVSAKKVPLFLSTERAFTKLTRKPCISFFGQVVVQTLAKVDNFLALVLHPSLFKFEWYTRKTKQNVFSNTLEEKRTQRPKIPFLNMVVRNRNTDRLLDKLGKEDFRAVAVIR